MSQITVEQMRFQQAVESPGLALLNFYSPEPADLIPNNTGACPDFFNHNLVSPYRVLKLFLDSPHSNIRIFYFQLLRVTYQVQTEQGFNRSFMYNLIHIVFNQNFQIFFTNDTDSQRDLYNDAQFKKLFAEFVNLLEVENAPQVEKTLNSYPIMDTVFIHIFRSILASQDINYSFDVKIPTETVIGELSGLLGLSVQAFGVNCWKFDDSDIFCYEHSENQLYMAYIVDAGVVTSEEASNDPAGYLATTNIRQQPLYSQIDTPTTHTIQIGSTTNKTEVSSERLRGDDNFRHDNYFETFALRTTPVVEAPMSYQSRVEEIGYKPSQSPIITSSNNSLSYSLGQSNYQSVWQTPDPLYKSTAGAYLPSYEPLAVSQGLSSYDPLSLSKPTSAYASFDQIDYTSQSYNVRNSGAADFSLGSRNSFGDGDYYNDFTNDRLVDKLEEPFRSKVVQIKSRVKGWRKVQVPVSVSIGASASSLSYASSSQQWSKPIFQL